MKELVELCRFIDRRLDMTDAMTNTTAILSDGIFGPHRRPALAGYNIVFEEEARCLFAQLFQVPRTAHNFFELAELFKFGINDYFPGVDIAVDYARAAYWFLAAADLGNKETLKFLHRMVPQYFMPNITPEDMHVFVIEALVTQENLAKSCQVETIAERKRREAFNNFAIDLSLYPVDQELDGECWFDILWKRVGFSGGETADTNNVRPLFEF